MLELQYHQFVISITKGHQQPRTLKKERERASGGNTPPQTVKLHEEMNEGMNPIQL